MNHTNDHVNKLLDECVSKLGEHCDSIVIMVTIPCDDCGGAESVCFGKGNPMAQLGMAHEFIARRNAIIQAQVSANLMGEFNEEEEG